MPLRPQGLGIAAESFASLGAKRLRQIPVTLAAHEATNSAADQPGSVVQKMPTGPVLHAPKQLQHRGRGLSEARLAPDRGQIPIEHGLASFQRARSGIWQSA